MRHLVVCSWLFAVAICCLVTPHVDAGDDSKLRVATFCSDATPPLGSPTYGGKPLETVETPLLAKGIVLDDGQQRYVVCAIDWCGLCGSAHMLFRNKIAAGAGIDVSNVAVHTVHQHTAPYLPIGSLVVRDKDGNPPKGVDPPVVHQIAERLGQAVKRSLGEFQPFDSIGTGQAKVDRVASARRILTADGKIRTRWSACTDPELRAEPEGYIDPILKTVTLAQGDKPLVRIHYYATHPQSFYGDARVCYDVPGFARQRLEKKEKVFQIYFTGCAGDVVMGKYNDRTPQARAELTDRLYAGMEASVASTRMVPVERIDWRTLPLVLPLKDEAAHDIATNRSVIEDTETPDKDRMQAARVAEAASSVESVTHRAGRAGPFAWREHDRISVVYTKTETGSLRGRCRVRRFGNRLHLHRAGVLRRRLRTKCVEGRTEIRGDSQEGDLQVARARIDGQRHVGVPK